MQAQTAPIETEAPSKACWFTDRDIETIVQFADAGDAKEKGDRLRIVGYSGGIITNHWYWGNLAFDVAGIKFAKKRTPILAEHDIERRVSVADRQEIGDKVTFEGRFLTNPDAQRIKQDLAEDFPMEASLYIEPTKIEPVPEGTEVEVNGRTLKGPGTVFRKSVVKEVSICVFGADSATSAQAFDAKTDTIVRFERTGKEQTTMPEQAKPITLEILQKDHPDVYAAAFKAGQADGEARERKCFTEILAACDGDTAIAAQCYKDGKTPQDAMAVKLSAVKAENQKLHEQLTMSPAQREKPVDPAIQEFSDSEAAQKARRLAAKPEKAGDLPDVDAEDIKAIKAAWDGSDRLRGEYMSPESLQTALRLAAKRQ